MTSLNQLIQELRTALKKNVNTERSKAITENCQEILNRLEPSGAQILLNLQVREVMSEGSTIGTVSCPPSPELRNQAVRAQKALEAFRQAWTSQGDRVRESKELDVAVDLANALVKRFSEDLRVVWDGEVKGFRRKFFIDPPVLQAQKSVPGSERICQGYEKSLQEFEETAKVLPTAAKTLESMRTLTTHLSELKGQMTFDIPSEVNAFFRRLDAQPLGIPLGQVPRSVLDWLGEKEQLNRFLIKRAQG